jgi:GH25 family lysozyme M1 (1,4-beta-N-acetylmuramidase)
MASYIKGLDVSQMQDAVDWEKVAAAGFRFAILRCGVGNDGIDSRFHENVAGCRANGIAPGAYQFIFPIGLPSTAAEPNRQPEEQAKLHFGFSQGLGCGAGELQPFTDNEWPASAADIAAYGCSPPQTRDWIERYKLQYEQESGVLVGAYTDEYWWEQNGGGALTSMSATPFWAADPQPTAALPLAGQSPKVYRPFQSWSIWQYTWRGVVPGIVDYVDLDCIPDEDTFKALTTRP